MEIVLNLSNEGCASCVYEREPSLLGALKKVQDG